MPAWLWQTKQVSYVWKLPQNWAKSKLKLQYSEAIPQTSCEVKDLDLLLNQGTDFVGPRTSETHERKIITLR